MLSYKLSFQMRQNERMSTAFGGNLSLFYFSCLIVIAYFIINDFSKGRMTAQTYTSTFSRQEIDSTIPFIMASFSRAYNTTFYTNSIFTECSFMDFESFNVDPLTLDVDTIYYCFKPSFYDNNYLYQQLIFTFSSPLLSANSSLALDLKTRIIASYEQLNEDSMKFETTFSVLDLHEFKKKELQLYLVNYFIDSDLISESIDTTIKLKDMIKISSDSTFTSTEIVYYIRILDFLEARYTSVKLPMLLSKLMAYISIVFIILSRLSLYYSDYKIVKYVIDNLMTQEERSKIVNQLTRKNQSLEKMITLWSYISWVLLIRFTNADSDFNILMSNVYSKTGIERVLKKKRNFLEENSKEINMKRISFLERFDYLSPPISVYYKSRSKFSSRFSKLLTLLFYAVCGVIFYLLGYQFVTKTNPQFYVDIPFIGDSTLNQSSKSEVIKSFDSFINITMPQKFYNSMLIFMQSTEIHLVKNYTLNANSSAETITLSFKFSEIMSEDFFEKSKARNAIVFLRCDSYLVDHLKMTIRSQDSDELKIKVAQCNNTMIDLEKSLIIFSFESSTLDLANATDPIITNTVTTPFNHTYYMNYGISKNNFGWGYQFKTLTDHKDIWSIWSESAELIESHNALSMIYQAVDVGYLYDFGFELYFFPTHINVHRRYKRFIDTFTSNSVLIGLIYSAFIVIIDFLSKFFLMVDIFDNNASLIQINNAPAVEDSKLSMNTQFPNNNSLRARNKTMPSVSVYSLILDRLLCRLSNHRQVEEFYKEFMSFESIIGFQTQEPQPRSRLVTSLISKVDLLPQNSIFLTVNNQRFLVSNLGGCFSIIIFLVMITLCYFKFEEVLNWKNPTVFSNLLSRQEYLNLIDECSIKDYSIPFLFEIEKTLYNQQYYDLFEFSSWGMVLNRCHELELDKFISNSTLDFITPNHTLNEYLCYNLNNDLYSFAKGISVVNPYYFYNCNDAYWSSLPHNAYCNWYYAYETRKYNMKLIILNTAFNVSNPDNPQFSQIITTDISNPFQYITIEVTNIAVTRDISLLTSKASLECVYSVVNVRAANNVYVDVFKQFSIELSNSNYNHFIKYKKLDYAVIEIISLLNILVIVLGLVNSIYSEYKLIIYVSGHILDMPDTYRALGSISVEVLEKLKLSVASDFSFSLYLKYLLVMGDETPYYQLYKAALAAMSLENLWQPSLLKEKTIKTITFKFKSAVNASLKVIPY